MYRTTAKRLGPGLRRRILTDGDMIINRPPRRSITGVVLSAQRSHLVPDEPDSEGRKSYFCKITDMSDGGFCVLCRMASEDPRLFKPGVQMILEGPGDKRRRVQIRWLKDGRIGLKLLVPEAQLDQPP